MNSAVQHPTVPRWITVISVSLSVLGLVSLVLVLAFGFETPNTALLLVGLLVFAAPLSVFFHVATTQTLTADEKRLWMRELTGSDAFAALSEYMTSPDLRESARRRAEDAATRRTNPSHP